MLGLLVGISAVSVSFYYESRVLMFLIVIFLIVSFFVIGWKRALIYSGITIGTWLLLTLYVSIMRSIDQAVFDNKITLFNFQMDTTYFNSYKERFGDYFNSVTSITPQLNDTDRMTSIIEPIKASSLFGYGTYQHHTVLVPYIKTSNFIRTTGFGAFLTDYGWVGFGLLVLNFICTGLKLILNRSKIWLLMGVSLCFGFGWLFVSNILDNVLWWLLIVPFGILERLNYEVKG